MKIIDEKHLDKIGYLYEVELENGERFLVSSFDPDKVRLVGRHTSGEGYEV